MDRESTSQVSSVDLEGVDKELSSKVEEIREGVVKLINRVRSEKVTSAFFLDKSARPLSWMFRETWLGLVDKGLISKDEKMPAIRFINVGREQDENMFDPDSTAMEKARQKYKVPQDGPIMVIDEFSENGTTLRRAEKVIGRIFKNRDVYPYVALKVIPPWYGHPSLIGVEEKAMNDEGEVEEGDQVWAYPIVAKATITGVVPADNTRNLAFRRLLKQEVVDHIVSGALRRTDGSILLPDFKIGFRAE